jgi:Domain of unknown function (DUF5069)
MVVLQAPRPQPLTNRLEAARYTTKDSVTDFTTAVIETASVVSGMTTKALDLTKVSPASPSKRVGGYVILARLADKARAEFLGGNIGEYHTDCPLDHLLLDWKGVPYDEVKKSIIAGASNEQVATHLDSHGTKKTAEEVKAWSDNAEKQNPYENPEKREWYESETKKLGLDAATTPMFRWLDTDDKASH